MQFQSLESDSPKDALTFNPEPRQSPYEATLAPSVPDDGLNAVRGVLIGLAIGLSMWAALFGAWLLA